MEAARFEETFPKLAHRIGDRNVPVLAALLHEREVPAEAVLIEDRAPVSSLFLVASGEFRIEITGPDQTLALGRLRQGKWVGEISLFGNDNSATARVIAAVPSRVLELPHALFWSAREEHPDLMSALTKEFVDMMSERMRATKALMANISPGEGSVSAGGQGGHGANQTWIKSVLRKVIGVEG
jgi:CRP-like cAMP-binding protein